MKQTMNFIPVKNQMIISQESKWKFEYSFHLTYSVNDFQELFDILNQNFNSTQIINLPGNLKIIYMSKTFSVKKSKPNPYQPIDQAFDNEFVTEADIKTSQYKMYGKNGSAKYFIDLFRKIPQDSIKKTYDDVNTVAEKVQHKVQDGNIKVNKDKGQIKSIMKINNQIELKRRSLSTEIKKFTLAVDMENSSRMSHSNSENKFNLKQRIKTVADPEEIIQVIEKRKVAEERLRNWKKKTLDVRNIRRKAEEQRRMKTQQAQKFMHEKQQENLKLHRLNKHEAIRAKIAQINKRKLERDEVLRKSKSSRSSHVPKYKLEESRFLEQQKTLELQRLELRKLMRKKMERQFDIEHIREHSKLYNELVKSRVSTEKRVKTEGLEKSKSLLESKFKIIGRTQTQVKEEKKRSDRRNLFQSRVKQIPIKPSLKKMIETEINKDKAAHPLKYNFLSQKALDDLCIFTQFQGFEIPDFDRKVIGNQYLNEVKEKVKNSRVVSNTSTRKVKTESKSDFEDRRGYKNYLKEIKIKKPSQRNEIDQIVKLSNNKSQVIMKLREESNRHQNRVMKKIMELKKSKNYDDSLKKEEQIDNEYLNSLKARVKVLELH